MSLCYSCISREQVILVEKSLGSQNHLQTVKEVLAELIFTANRKTSIPNNEFLIHTIIEDGICYLCVAHRDMGRRTPYLFLDEVKKRFVNSGSLYQRSTTASGYEFNRDFSRSLYDVMSDFNSGKGDNLSVLQNQVGEVTGVMKQNIEKVLERGDKLDDLVDKSDELQAGAATFKTTSRKVSRKFYWQNKKMLIIIIIVVVVIVTIIILAATGVI